MNGEWFIKSSEVHFPVEKSVPELNSKVAAQLGDKQKMTELYTLKMNFMACQLYLNKDVI